MAIDIPEFVEGDDINPLIVEARLASGTAMDLSGDPEITPVLFAEGIDNGDRVTDDPGEDEWDGFDGDFATDGTDGKCRFAAIASEVDLDADGVQRRAEMYRYHMELRSSAGVRKLPGGYFRILRKFKP